MSKAAIPNSAGVGRFYGATSLRRRRGARASDLADPERVNAHRLGDVLKRPLAEVDKVRVDSAANMIVGGAGDANAARFRDALQTRRDVDAVAENILALDQHVAEMDAHAVDDAASLRGSGVALDHHLLDRHRTFDGGDNGGKLEQQTVAHGLDDPPAETRNDWNRRSTVFAHRLCRARLVLAHQPGITDNVDGHDCGEFPRFAHGVLHAPSLPA